MLLGVTLGAGYGGFLGLRAQHSTSSAGWPTPHHVMPKPAFLWVVNQVQNRAEESWSNKVKMGKFKRSVLELCFVRSSTKFHLCLTLGLGGLGTCFPRVSAGVLQTSWPWRAKEEIPARGRTRCLDIPLFWSIFLVPSVLMDPDHPLSTPLWQTLLGKHRLLLLGVFDLLVGFGPEWLDDLCRADGIPLTGREGGGDRTKTAKIPPGMRNWLPKTDNFCWSFASFVP